METILLYSAIILAVTLLAWCWQPHQKQDEPAEFGATFDALQAEKDEAAKSRARCREREAINRAADSMIARAKFGPQHDPVEL